MKHPKFESLDELVRALQVRKDANSRAEQILISLTAHAIEAAPMNRQERDAILVTKGREALRSFCLLPCLTEFRTLPELAGVYKTEPTFIVSRIFNFLIEYTLDRSFPTWQGANKAMLVRLLIELVKQEPGDLMEAMMSVIKFKDRPNDTERIKEILADVRGAILALLSDYELTETVDGKLQTSYFGKRLIRHLIDAQEFSTAATAGFDEFIRPTLKEGDDGTEDPTSAAGASKEAAPKE